MLISSVLDISSVDFTEGNDLPYALYLPTYTAAAHFHGVITGDLRTLIGQAEEFAARDLPWALARGNRLTATERADIVRRYAELTGLSPEYVDRADLRVDLFAFAAELLRDRTLQLGRLDLRFASWLVDANAQKLEDDPSYRALIGPYAAAFNAYIRGELGYQTDLAYNLLTAKVQPWSYKEFEGKSIEVASKLVEAMRANPRDAGARGLRVLRRGDPALRRRARLRPPPAAQPGGLADRVGLLRGRTHDVRPRTEPAAAIGRLGRVCRACELLIRSIGKNAAHE